MGKKQLEIFETIYVSSWITFIFSNSMLLYVKFWYKTSKNVFEFVNGIINYQLFYITFFFLYCWTWFTDIFATDNYNYFYKIYSCRKRMSHEIHLIWTINVCYYNVTKNNDRTRSTRQNFPTVNSINFFIEIVV